MLTLTLTLTMTACSVELESVPLPKRNVGSDSYTVYATFENALNLPKQAKVKLAGADVGSVEGMTVRDYAAIVTLKVSEGVTLPVGTRAELRSATPLGDIFVAMRRHRTGPDGGCRDDRRGSDHVVTTGQRRRHPQHHQGDQRPRRRRRRQGW
jgi:ABC-type transporter Mla subunit MlaD